MQVFLIIYFTLAIIANTFVYKNKFNFINIILIIWGLCSILSSYGFYEMYIPSNKVYVYILVFLTVFQVFSAFFYKIKYNVKLKKYEDIDIKWRILNIFMICLIFIMSISTIKGIQILVSTGSFSAVREAYLNDEIFNNKLEMLLTIAIIPLGLAIGFFSITDYVETKKIKSTLLLFLIFMIELVISTAARFHIVTVLCIFIIALLEKYNKKIIRIIKYNKKIILIVSIIFFILIFITLQRNLSNGGFLYNIYAYFVGSIHLLGVYIRNADTYLLNSQNILYGQVILSGFYYPITFILRNIGIDVTAGVYQIKEITQSYIEIANDGTRINNSVTCIYSALRDFGEFGLVIYPVILAFFGMLFYKKMKRKNNVYYKTLFYYFLYNLIFLIMEFTFALPSTIFTFVYMVILFKICNKEKEDEK